MEEIEVFLASHPKIETVVLLLGECGVERLKEFFKYTSIKKCTVIHSMSKNMVKDWKASLQKDSEMGVLDLPEQLVFSSMSKIKTISGNWALGIINGRGEEVAQILEFHPEYVIGSIKEGKISAFSLWEKSRNSCKKVLLKTVRDGRSSIVLDWEKKNEVELSIIFPVYNVAKYLDKCIESVTAWNADYIEYIFVSDGSKDESVDIIRNWMEKDRRIILIEKENGGCASARQKGLEEARGRYVGFVDPDDFVHHNMFRRLLKVAMSGSYDISLCGYNEYYENSGKIKPADDSLWYPYLDGCFDRNKIIELITYCRVAIWRGIYRMDFLKQNGIGFYTDLKRFDDLPFKVETFAFAKSVTMLDEYLYYYRLEREGQDVSATDERLYVHFDIFKHLDESIGSLGNQRMIDNLQMCKIQTHRYALGKIQEEYKEEYLRRTRQDLNSLCDFQRSYKIAKIMLGDEVAEEYKKIMNR